MDLLLATRNPHKTREFSEILGDKFAISDLSSIENIPEIEETGDTLEANAILKGVTASKFLKSAQSKNARLSVIADDSGLEVDALNGAPGVFSARYAGEKATDQQNVEKLLRALAAVEDRSARFRCVIALVQDAKVLRTFEGSVEGVIIDTLRGTNGFGYDPVFRPNGFDETFGELGDHVKAEISHRAKAVKRLTAFLSAGR